MANKKSNHSTLVEKNRAARRAAAAYAVAQIICGAPVSKNWVLIADNAVALKLSSGTRIYTHGIAEAVKAGHDYIAASEKLLADVTAAYLTQVSALTDTCAVISPECVECVNRDGTDCYEPGYCELVPEVV